MEINEAARRILQQHWRVVLVSLLVGLGVASFAHSGRATSYSATTRLVLDTQDPKSRTESEAIADTAKAIATSPQQVATALRRIRVQGRDPEQIARHDVGVAPLGTSAVLSLTVRDRDPKVAAALSTALARVVIRTRLGVTNGHLPSALAALDRRIVDLNTRIAAIDVQMDALNARLAATAGGAADALRAKADNLARTRDFLTQQRGVLESERVGLTAADAMRPKPAVLSPAKLPLHPDPSHRGADLLLGALLGIVAGVGIAGLLETFWPTLVGGLAVARELDTALLGTLEGSLHEDEGSAREQAAAARIRMAAEAKGARTVQLVPVGRRLDLWPLARRLERVEFPGAEAEGEGGAVAGAAPARCRVRPFVLGGGSRSARSSGSSALVVVAPDVVKRSKLVDLAHLLRVTPQPLLGVVTYRRPLWQGGAGPSAHVAPQVGKQA